MKNDLKFLHHIIFRLQRAGISCLVFGGWAKELAGVIAPRPHSDVDLLYISDDFEKVDAFIKNERDIKEILGKRFYHKRAFLCDNIMVELLLVSRRGNRYLTNFWGEYEFEWPEPATIQVRNYLFESDVSVCAPPVVDHYQQHEKQIAEVRARYLPRR